MDNADNSTGARDISRRVSTCGILTSPPGKCQRGLAAYQSQFCSTHRNEWMGLQPKALDVIIPAGGVKSELIATNNAQDGTSNSIKEIKWVVQSKK